MWAVCRQRLNLGGRQKMVAKEPVSVQVAGRDVVIMQARDWSRPQVET